MTTIRIHFLADDSVHLLEVDLYHLADGTVVTAHDKTQADSEGVPLDEWLQIVRA